MPETNTISRKIKYCLVAFSATTIATLFFSETACAFVDGDTMQGAAYIGQQIWAILANTLVFVAGGIVALHLTTGVLQWLIINNSALLDLNASEFVNNGLKFTQGLADILLLLAFVAVAMGIIFKYRDFEAKKMLPRLIAVAILTRFGPLAVKMMVDIGNVAINTVVGNNANLFNKVTDILLQDMWDMLATILTMAASAGLAMSLPFLNSIAAIGQYISWGVVAAGMVVGVAGSGFFLFNFIASWVFQIITSYLMAGILMSFIFLFGARIFMIQILAVVSPLAIFAYALPQTENHFKNWWNALVSWTFLGVWVLFFMMLGFGSLNFLNPTDISAGVPQSTVSGLTQIASIDKTIIYYFLLITFLGTLKYLADKQAPVMGSVLQSFAMGAGGMAFTHVAKPALGKMSSGAMGQNQKYADLAKTNPTLFNKAMAATTGSFANLTDTDTISKAGNIFSGAPSKIAAATSWKIGANKLTGTADLLNRKVSEAGKDNSVEKVIAKGDRAGVAEAIWAMKNAKPEELPALIKSFGSNAGTWVNTAIREGMLSPSTLQKLPTATGALGISSELVNKIYSGASDSQKIKAQVLRGGAADANNPDEMKKEKEMTARIDSYKGAAIQKSILAKLPHSFFEDTDLASVVNRDAFFANATIRTLGNAAREFDEVKQDQLGKHLSSMDDLRFANMVKANQDLIFDMATHPQYKRYLPNSVRVGQQPNGAIDIAALNRLLDQNHQITP